MKRCPNERCPSRNYIKMDSDNFCYYCGAKLEGVELKKCECGRVLSRYDKYCPHCGKKVEQ